MLRRASPAHNSELAGGRGNDVDPFDEQSATVHELTERLDDLRTELQLVEDQEREDELEHVKLYNSLISKKEELQLQQGKRENESKELKRLVTSLEQANTTAQRKRTLQEKALQQKLTQRNKVQEDAQRWQREVAEMKIETTQIAIGKDHYASNSRQRIQELRDEQEPDLQDIKSLEEQIRLTGIEVKSLEEAKAADDEAAENDLKEYQKAAETADALWRTREMELHHRYMHSNGELHAANSAYNSMSQRFGYMGSRRLSQSTAYAPIYTADNSSAVSENHAYQSDSQGRAFSGQLFNPTYPDHNGLDVRQISGSVSRHQASSEAEDSARSSSPFFSVDTNIPLFSQPSNGMSERDVQALTGGALMSPSANNLLPSDLLGDDLEDMTGRTQIPPNNRDEPVSQVEEAAARRLPIRLNPGLSSRNPSHQSSSSEVLPGLGAVPGMKLLESAYAVPNSPSSMRSRSPSLVSSPHGSNTNLHYRNPSDTYLESDRRSIRSVSSTSQVSRSAGRFGSLWSGRQRGRTTSEDGPAFGSLTQHQSRSMPRQLEEDNVETETRPSEPKRLSSLGSRLGFGSSTTTRRNISMSNVGEVAPASSLAGSNKFKSLGILGSKAMPWRSQAIVTAAERSASPRPASTYSLDKALPPPEIGQQFFGWDNSSGAQVRDTSSLWSAIPNSRRASIHQDVFERPLSDLHDLGDSSHELPPLRETAPQAPIGTRPSKDDSDSTPRMSSSTPYFKMMGRDKRTDKSPGKSRKRGKGSDSVDEQYTTSGDGHSSPPESQYSREYALGSGAESLENLGETPTDDGLSSQESGLQPGSASKESFMRKMTRKGSSSRFGLPNFKEKGGLFSRKAHNEDVEDDGSTLGASVGSLNSIPSPSLEKRSAFSLASLRKRGKKGPSAPSISEASMTSGTGDEEESRASVDG